MSSRDATLDISKGLAIIAIVAGHVLRGVANAGLMDKASIAYEVADRAIYSIHLTVFAFAAGLVVQRSVDRRGARQYLRHRLSDFAWLFVVWTLAQGSLQVFLAGSVNNAQTWPSVAEALVRPHSHMWFFPWIAVVSVLVTLARPWSTPLRAWGWGVSTVAVSIGLWGVFGPFIFLQGHGNTGFFVIAAIWSLQGFQALTRRRGVGSVVAVGTALFAVWAALIVWTPAAGPTYSLLVRTPANIALSVVATSAGVAAVFSVSAVLARLPRGAGWLAYLGRHSLQVFLAHVIPMAAARIVLVKLGVTDLVVHMATGTLAGVLGALVAWYLTRRWAPWLWRSPAALSGQR